MRPLTIRGGTFARPESIVSDIKDHADASVPVSKFCGMSQRTAQDLPLVPIRVQQNHDSTVAACLPHGCFEGIL